MASAWHGAPLYARLFLVPIRFALCKDGILMEGWANTGAEVLKTLTRATPCRLAWGACGEHRQYRSPPQVPPITRI